MEAEIGTTVIMKFYNQPFVHYGIIGPNNTIIHALFKNDIITQDPIEKYINKSTSITYLDESPEVKLRTYNNAKKWIGKKYNFNFQSSNCEAFVNMLKTGIKESKQINSWIDILSASILLISVINN